MPSHKQRVVQTPNANFIIFLACLTFPSPTAYAKIELAVIVTERLNI